MNGNKTVGKFTSIRQAGRFTVIELVFVRKCIVSRSLNFN